MFAIQNCVYEITKLRTIQNYIKKL